MTRLQVYGRRDALRMINDILSLSAGDTVGLISKTIDKLPAWAKLVFWAATAVASIYCIRQYGFFHFLLRVIFSPSL